MKNVLMRLVLVIVFVIAGQAVAWEVGCSVRSFYFNTKPAEQLDLCKDAANRSIATLTGVLSTLLALLVKTDGESSGE